MGVEGLVERERQLASIGDKVRAATEGRGSVLVLTGPAGIGKTALLDRARELGDGAGMTVLTAHGADLERSFGFGVVRQLFEGPLRAGQDGALEGAAAVARSLVLPGAPAEIVGDRRALLHGLHWLAVNLAERSPLLLAVDDAHWADAGSLAYLAYLARRLDGVPALLAVTVRAGDPPAYPLALEELLAAAGEGVVEPPPLSADGVAALVGARLGAPNDADFVAACAAASGGVPFLVVELLAALAAAGVQPTADAVAAIAGAGPASVAAALTSRLGRLPAEVGAVAQAVAILGRHARLDRVAGLAGVDPDGAAAALDVLVGMRVLEPGMPVRFAHPLVQQAVHEALGPTARAVAHGRVAVMLTGEGASAQDVATHLLGSAPLGDGQVVALLRTAAGAALAAGAPESAVAYLRRALEEDSPATRADVLAELGRAEAVAQDPAAVAHLEEAAGLGTGAVQRARLLFELADLVLLFGEWDRRLELLGQALTTLGDADLDLQARVEAARAGSELYDPRFAGAYEERLPELRRLVGLGLPGSRGLALVVACVAALRGTAREEVLELVEVGLDAGGLLRDEGPASLVLPHAVAPLIALDEVERLERGTAAVLEEARRRGSVPGTIAGSIYRMAVAAQRGALREAESDLRVAADLAFQHGLVFAVTGIVTFGVDVLLERPALADVAGALTAIRLDPTWAATASGAWLAVARGRLALQRGDREAAERDLRTAGEIYEGTALTNPIATVWRSPLALALPPAQVEEARRLAREELALATQAGLPRARAVALRALGCLESGGDALALHESSLAVLDQVDAPLERARCLVELGSALRRAGQRVAAREQLAAGLDLADRCGAEHLAGRVERELHALGARPRRRALSGLHALTASELRVARLAGDGLSNREIAQALFVTAKTVENQLGAAYRKLGVRSREELPGVLAGA